MRDKKKLKRWLYVTAPLLWCGILYFGNNNSLGTVLAKSVATTIQTLSTITTQTEVNTVAQTVTDVQVPTGIETDITTVETISVLSEYIDTVVRTTYDASGPTLVEETIPVSTMVPTETVNVVRTVLPTQTQMAVSTEMNTVMTTLTQLVTMTETVITTDDGQSTNSVTDQVVPSETPSTVPSVAPSTTPSTVPSVVPSTTPSTVPSVVPSTTPSTVPSVVPSTTPSTVPSEAPSSTSSTVQYVLPLTTPLGAPETVMESTPIKSWTPETEDEKERASYVQKGEVKLKKGNRLVSIQKVMQGPLCIAAMKNAMLQDEKIAYTYNIKYIAGGAANRTVYEIDEPIEISMEMPKELMKEGRTFYMICVSEDGMTYRIPVAVDEDGNLTFTTKYFYAYAIIYKDA